MTSFAYPFYIIFYNTKGQTRQAQWLLTNLTFYNY